MIVSRGFTSEYYDKVLDVLMCSPGLLWGGVVLCFNVCVADVRLQKRTGMREKMSDA